MLLLRLQRHEIDNHEQGYQGNLWGASINRDETQCSAVNERLMLSLPSS